jgi:hypothetical protein
MLAINYTGIDKEPSTIWEIKLLYIFWKSLQSRESSMVRASSGAVIFTT